MSTDGLILSLQAYPHLFCPVVPFDPVTDQFFVLDFTAGNTALSADQISDTDSLAAYINQQIASNHCRYGIGGYNEHRTLYGRSNHFDAALKSDGTRAEQNENEQRRLHLGTDIWGPVGTPVMAPLDGIVHSYAFNNHDSDYGATIILSHNLHGTSFHTLYGHLSLNSIKNLQEGQRIKGGQTFAEFGMRFENGNWPPHLHFQLIKEMGEWLHGDYPGVCAFSDRDRWLQNSPDPELVLHLKQYSK